MAHVDMGAVDDLLSEKGISVSQLARDMDIDRAMLTKWRNGRYRPSLEMAVRMANALDCSVDDIIVRDTADALSRN
jgi:transcriptional regulator with XRE-family HTH domain